MKNSRNGHNKLGIGDTTIFYHISYSQEETAVRVKMSSSENVYWGPQRNLLIYYTLTFSLYLVDKNKVILKMST